jgi:polysaccharide export outer membrane protein
MRVRILFTIVNLLVFTALSFAQDSPTPAQIRAYRMWPGDEVTAKVSGETDFDFTATVSEDGMIVVPFDSKPIVAKCRTEEDVKADLNKILGKYLRNPMLSFRVTDRKSRPPATISGEVNSPQQVILYRKVTLLEMLSVAGGVKDEAGGTIQVFRTQPPICEGDDKTANWMAAADDPSGVPSRVFNMSEVKVAKDDSNPIIYPGDVIIVQRATPVYITGEVANPQGIYIKEGGLSLAEAIAKIGGIGREAKTTDIKVYRLKANSKDREILNANYDLIRKGKQKDIMLQPYDIVEVDKAKDSIATTIMKIAIGAGRNLVGGVTNGIGYRVMY